MATSKMTSVLALFLPNFKKPGLTLFLELTGRGTQELSLQLKSQFSQLESEDYHSVFLIVCCED